MAVINSAFDVLDDLTVEEALSNPHYLPQKVLEEIDGREVQKLFFRDITTPSNVIGWKDRAVPGLEDGVQNVAEFGVIPVSDPTDGAKTHYKSLNKKGIGIRVSYEQIKDNDTDAVKRELVARKNEILRANVAEALAALREADIQEHTAQSAWDQQGSDPARDVLDAIDIILGAEDDNGHYFEYQPNVIWINPLTLNILKSNEKVQQLYIGDMASENPYFKGVSEQPQIFGGLDVAASFYVPKGKAYIGVQREAGFMAQREPQQITEFYAERGESKLLGATMSQRSDYVHRRVFGIDAPKSVVKLSGLVTG